MFVESCWNRSKRNAGLYTIGTALILLVSLPDQDDKFVDLDGTYGHMRRKT